MPGSFKEKYSVEARYIPTPSRRRSGEYVEPAVKFVVAHDTGNPGALAAANVSYYQRTRDQQSSSAHLFVDDRGILECIPALTGPAEKAWHVLYSVPTDDRLFGFNANDAAIGVEYCYGAGIDADEAYHRYLWVIAKVCHAFSLDPASSVVGHFFLDPTRRTDPVTGLARSRRTYEQFLRDVVREYAECSGVAFRDSPGLVEGEPGTATVLARLNLRRGQSSTRAAVVRVVPAGAALSYTGWVTGGEPIHGNARWFVDADGNYFWSGAVK